MSSTLAKRYTLVLNPGSSKVGELHYESRAGYMRNLGPATLMADGYLMRGAGYWLMPGQFTVLPAVLDRVLAKAQERAAQLLGTQYSERGVA